MSLHLQKVTTSSGVISSPSPTNFFPPDSRCPGSISAEVETDIEGVLAMTFTTAFLAATLVMPSMPPPEYDDCEVVTNCVFDASRGDAKMFALKIELDATSSNGVEVVFGRDADGDPVADGRDDVRRVRLWRVEGREPHHRRYILQRWCVWARCAQLETATQRKSNAALDYGNDERTTCVHATVPVATAIPF